MNKHAFQWIFFCCNIKQKCLLYISVTVNESQVEITAERGQDFVWRVEQRNKKTYLKFDVSKNRENVEVSGICRDTAYIVYKFLLHKSRLRDEHREQVINWREEERKNGPDEREAKLEDKILCP